MTPIVLRVHISENETLKDDFSFAFGIKLLAQLVLAGYGFEVKPPLQESLSITDFKLEEDTRIFHLGGKLE